VDGVVVSVVKALHVAPAGGEKGIEHLVWVDLAPSWSPLFSLPRPVAPSVHDRLECRSKDCLTSRCRVFVAPGPRHEAFLKHGVDELTRLGVARVRLKDRRLRVS